MGRSKRQRAAHPRQGGDPRIEQAGERLDMTITADCGDWQQLGAVAIGALLEAEKLRAAVVARRYRLDAGMAALVADLAFSSAGGR